MNLRSWPLLLGAGVAIAHAAPAIEGEADPMGPALQVLLRDHAAEVYACVRSTTAEDEALFRFFVGDSGSVEKPEILKVEDRSGQGKAVAHCLVEKLRHWNVNKLPASAGDQVVFPLVFKPKPERYHIPAAAQQEGEVVSDATVGEGASLIVRHVELEAGITVGPHLHDVEEMIWVLRGSLQFANGKKLRSDELAWFAAGQPHSVRTLEASEFILVHGPRRTGSSVKTTAAKAGGPPGLVVVAKQPKAIELFGGRGSVRLRLDGSSTPCAMNQLLAKAGVEVAPHVHADSDEFIFVRAGQGQTTVGEKTFSVWPGDGIWIPKGTKHSLQVLKDLDVIQLYSPKGPEQRFKRSQP